MLSSILVSLLPLALLALVLVVVGVAVVATVNDDAGRGSLASGMLIGVGFVLAFGTIGTVVSCSNTPDFCGNANVVPFALAVLAAVGVGAVTAGMTAVRNRR